MRSRPEILSNDIPAQRQWQLRFFVPPFPQIDHFVKPKTGKGKLSLVDDESCLRFAPYHRLEDLVERHHQRNEIRLEDSQNQKRRGHFPGTATTLPFSSCGFMGDSDTTSGP